MVLVTVTESVGRGDCLRKFATAIKAFTPQSAPNLASPGPVKLNDSGATTPVVTPEAVVEIAAVTRE